MHPDWGRWFVAPAAMAGIALTPVLWLRRLLPDTPAALVLEMAVFGAGAGIPLLLVWRKQKAALVHGGTGRR